MLMKNNNNIRHTETLENLPIFMADFIRIAVQTPKFQNYAFLLTFLLSLSYIAVQSYTWLEKGGWSNESTLITDVSTSRNLQNSTQNIVTLEDYQPLTGSTWFGSSLLLNAADLKNEIVEVETALNLSLKGTIMGANPRVIILNNQNNSTAVLREGEEVLKGVQVSQILRRKVVLNNQGKLETLSLPSINNLFDDYQEEHIISVVGNHSASNKEMAVKDPTYTPLAERAINKKQTLNVNRAEALSAVANLGALSKEARFIPYVKSGKLEAFRITNLANESFLRKLSLQEGDILIKLDDVPVHNREKLFPMIMNLSSAKSAQLVLERRGEIIQLNINVM